MSEDPATLDPLVQRLTGEAQHFGLFQAIRLLEAFHPEAAPVGHQGPPGREVVRLAGVLGLSFPASDIERLERIATQRYRLETSILGIYGVDSPLPEVYTEELLDQDEPEREQEFYDIFQHRLLSLLYRAWVRPRYDVQFKAGGRDRLSGWLRQLVHVDAAPEDGPLARQRLLGFAGLLAQQPRSAATLLAMARTSFRDVEIELEPFLERWVTLAADQQLRLGQGSTRLGRDAILGARIRDCSGSFLLLVSAPDLSTYRSYLPDGDRLAGLGELVSLFNTDLLDMIVELRLAPLAPASSRLGVESTRLGWSAWLGDPAPQARSVRFVFQGVLSGR